MARPLIHAATLGFALACAGAQAFAAESAYSKHAWERCREVGAGDQGVVERRCTGMMNIPVTWLAGDDSSSVSFGEKPLDETIGIGGFFEAGTTIEWRMAAAGRRPFAAIVRYATGRRIGRLDGSRLVVYRIAADGSSCIVGSVDGRAQDANQRARDLADGHAPGFVCGKSKRRN